MHSNLVIFVGSQIATGKKKLPFAQKIIKKSLKLANVD